MMRAMYEDSCCNLIEDKMSDCFDFKTSVRQGCFMSGFLIILAVDRVGANALRNRRRGLRWIFTSMFEDLEYTDTALI